MMKSYLKKQRLLKLASITCAMSFGVLATPSTFANIIINGGFETPAIPNGTWRNVNPNIDAPNWKQSFGSGIDVVNHLLGLGLPYEGQNFIELDTSESSGIYQDVPTTSGQSYTLKFAVSPRPKIPAADHKLRVLWNGSILDNLSAGAGGNTTSWKVYSYTVIGSAGTTRLEFKDTGPSNSFGMFLDAVSLEKKDPPHNPNLYEPMNVWEMTSYLDRSSKHQQKIVQQICFTAPSLAADTHWAYDWYSSFKDWSGKARQEGDQIFMHGDYSENNGHTSLQWEIVTQSKNREHQTKGFGHCADWQNNKVGSLGNTMIFANVKFVRINTDEKCEKFRKEEIKSPFPTTTDKPTDILIKTACGVKDNGPIIKKDDQLQTK